MSSRFKEIRSRTRATLGLLAGCALAVLLHAATPEPQRAGFDELDEVLVTAKVSWPLEDYVEFPRFESVVVSPGGTHLAMGWSDDRGYQSLLSVIDLPSMQPRSSVPQLTFIPTDLRWVDENQLVIHLDQPLRGFRRLRQRLDTLQVTDLYGRVLRELNPWVAGVRDNLESPGRDPLLQQRIVEQIAKQTGLGVGPYALGPVRTVAARTARPDQVLFQTVWTGDADKRGFGVFELDLAQCKQVRVASLPLRGGEVITGPDQRPALVAGVNEANERVVYFLPEAARAKGRDWQLIMRSRSGERGLMPLAWSGQDEKYYALDGRDLPTRAVVMWNARDNTQQLLYRHDDADMDGASFDPAGKPWMFSGLSQYPVYWYPDPTHPLAQLHHTVMQKLPREQVDILNATDDLATAVVRVSSGTRPTLFLLVDVKTGKSLTGMYAYPKLRGRRIAPVEAIEFAARDGLSIQGYLTTPLNQKGERRRGAPLLVIAHDGPSGEFPDYQYTADSRYDFERQLFASRGYAVLQVKVRGSGGRGMAFQRAGEGEWGRAVQDDYADAVRWAIKQGIADAGHACFYGTGYGAYSALMAAAREPDLFQCVIGIGGVYDLPRMIQDSRVVVRDLARAASVSVPIDSECHEMATVIAKDNMRPRDSTLGQVRKAVESLNGGKGAPIGIPPLLQRAVGNDLEQLKVRSPVSHASAIKAKVLLVEQFRDNQAADDQLAAMRTALRAARNPAQIDMIGEEMGVLSDGYFSPQMRADAYKVLLSFIGKQIGN